VGGPGLHIRLLPPIAAFAAAIAASCAWLSAGPELRTRPASPGIEPASVLAAPIPPVPARAAEPVSVEGLVLYGVSGASPSAAAIIGSRLGGQRVVKVGSDYRPGLRLAEIGMDYAILDNGARPVRLELSRYASGGSAKATAALPADEEQKIEAAVLRNILKPVVSGARTGGYALKPGESLPQLIRAGLRPGDVIVSVNGSRLDEERMSELAWQMGNSAKTEFVFLRNGKEMRGTL
jgi:hypothetical protein